MNVEEKSNKLLKHFFQDPDREWFAIELGDAMGFPAGTLYPALIRLEQRGHLSSRWEDLPEGETRRPRRAYKLTGPGFLKARELE